MPAKPTPIEHRLGKGIYRDGGCLVSATCLRCPLVVCIEDESPSEADYRRRNTAIVAAARNGATAREISGSFDVSMRTVDRVLAEYRSGAR